MRKLGLPLLLGLVVMVTMPMAWATILVGKGKYQVPAMILQTQKGPTAVFNLRSDSELRILLKGPVADQIPAKNWASILWIEIEVTAPMESPRGEATVLRWRPLKDEKVPSQVGNQLVPLK